MDKNNIDEISAWVKNNVYIVRKKLRYYYGSRYMEDFIITNNEVIEYLNLDNSIDYIYLKNSLTSLPYKFGIVNCGFNCSGLKLTSLNNCPIAVSGIFSCHKCEHLTNLIGAPKVVGSKFICSRCKNLKTLEGAPKHINNNFDCVECISIKTLEGSPNIVNGDFNCSGCYSLVSLKGVQYINGNFRHAYCPNLILD